MIYFDAVRGESLFRCARGLPGYSGRGNSWRAPAMSSRGCCPRRAIAQAHLRGQQGSTAREGKGSLGLPHRSSGFRIGISGGEREVRSVRCRRVIDGVVGRAVHADHRRLQGRLRGLWKPGPRRCRRSHKRGRHLSRASSVPARIMRKVMASRRPDLGQSPALRSPSQTAR